MRPSDSTGKIVKKIKSVGDLPFANLKRFSEKCELPDKI
jgi:hypothetical protein